MRARCHGFGDADRVDPQCVGAGWQRGHDVAVAAEAMWRVRGDPRLRILAARLVGGRHGASQMSDARRDHLPSALDGSLDGTEVDEFGDQPRFQPSVAGGSYRERSAEVIDHDEGKCEVLAISNSTGRERLDVDRDLAGYGWKLVGSPRG